MIRRTIHAVLWFIGLMAVLVAYFVVPVGRHTLFEHTMRIARTDPARELGREISSAGESLTEHAADAWESRRAGREETER